VPDDERRKGRTLPPGDRCAGWSQPHRLSALGCPPLGEVAQVALPAPAIQLAYPCEAQAVARVDPQLDHVHVRAIGDVGQRVLVPPAEVGLSRGGAGALQARAAPRNALRGQRGPPVHTARASAPRSKRRWNRRVASASGRRRSFPLAPRVDCPGMDRIRRARADPSGVRELHFEIPGLSVANGAA
jgi:hypothetical protein